MKMVKSLLLGSAAALVAVGGAQAADLPLKAKAVEYVKVCSLYGAGFWYIPGTDTCVKLSGYLRMDVAINTNADDTGNMSGAGGAHNRFTNAYTWRSREDLSIDTRTATEYGVLRTFFDGTFSWTDDSFAGTGGGATVYSPVGPFPFGSAPNNANAGAVAGGTVGVYYAFIQFAGFTMGKAISEFSAPWTNYPGNNYDGLVGGGGTVTGVNQFTYTAQFGNGVSAAISAQDPTAYYQAGVMNVSAGGPFGTSDYGGTAAPDIVGSVTVDQAWGLFKFSAAAHDNHAAYYGGTELTGHPDDRWGWAVQAALSIKNIPTGPGDVINVQGVFTDGATRYNIQDLAGGNAGAATMYGSTGLAGAYQSVGFGIAPDTVFGAAVGGGGTAQKLVQTWGGRGGYTHNWDPYWNTSIYGAWASVHYSGDAAALICGGVVDGLAFAGSIHAITPAGTAITTCNPNYNIAQAGIITRWTPVKNLTFSADFTWQHLDQKMVGTVSAASTTIGKPAAVYELRNQDNEVLLLRAQRNW
ncbi:MAG TPA: porin [Bradyrhizobium sp.]|uniref:porin n=1 Tax=Bradyrhizobium sp. TaxID=376 RepID=UPI002BBC1C7E|nr:porin [Bradyrhizobium sp.]HLZ06767.1 porin [Bradyrhizobium sp.]